MGRGYCYIAERLDGLSLRDLTASLAGIGVRLINPSNGAITRLSEEGDQILTTEVELANLLSRDRALTFQLWFPADVDLCCSYRRLSEDVCIHAYSLDGKDREQRHLLKRWAADYFRAGAFRNTAILMAFDPAEVTAQFDWDSFVLNNGKLPNTWPDVLGLRSFSLPADLTRWVHDYQSESINDYRLFTVKQGRGTHSS